MKSTSAKVSGQSIGLALSGGGARAIAFHLGCMRALFEMNLLQKVSAMSTVSGGSIIGAAYAYSNDTFAEFEARMECLLREGLKKHILGKALGTWRLPASLLTLIASGVPAGIASMVGKPPPFRRWISRTHSLGAALDDVLFGKGQLDSIRRNNLHIVINACELRTGSAFRFGSLESGSWRIGKVKEPVSIATAVAASAAYPLLFPPLDLRIVTQAVENRPKRTRVLLTDGGVYDNLGSTCLEPGRDPRISTNVFPSDYIICCHAGPGIPDRLPSPYLSYLIPTVDTMFRRVQDGGMARLFAYKKAGTLKGFILPFLGQRDDRLPHMPPDLVRREAVANYGTNFDPMPPEALRLIKLRGYQLTSLLSKSYCPEIITVD